MKKLLVLAFAFAIAFSATAQSIDHILQHLQTDKQRADTLYALAMKSLYRAQYDSGTYFLKKSIPYAERNNNAYQAAHIFLSLGNFQILAKRPGEGLEAVKKAQPYLLKITSHELQMKYYIFQAIAFGRLHQIDSALYYFRQAEALNNRVDPYKNWYIYLELGQMFKHAEAFHESEKYLLKAYELTKANGVRIDYGIALHYLADLYYDFGKAEKFAALLEKQQAFVQAGKRDFTKDPTHRLLFVDWQKKTFAEKVAFMEQVKQEFLKKEAHSDAALANLYLAEFYESENNLEKAIATIQENSKLLAAEKDILKLYANTKVRYRLLKKTGRMQEALADADRLFSLKDSMLRLQQRQTLLELEAKYESEKKERELALLNAENKLVADRLVKEEALRQALFRENLWKDSAMEREKVYSLLLSSENKLRRDQLMNEQALKNAVSRENFLKGEQLQKERRTRWLITIGAALLLMSGAVIFFLYRNQRRKNRLIQQQSEDLQVLMKEIHHRVKNNLQIISSLLDLQSLSIKDKEASEAIKDGKNRVLSMALIHQNLYNEGNIKGIKVRDYIQNLSSHLFASYNIEKDKIRLTTQIEPLTLDVDTVIPIGLIINELVSNSLKYAFKGKESGEMKIILRKFEKELFLQVKDNGIGFCNDKMENNNSFGYKLIRAFSQKLKARLEIRNDDGAVVTMYISKFKQSGIRLISRPAVKPVKAV